jgi:hypothetical protein
MAYQLLFYADDINVVEGNIGTGKTQMMLVKRLVYEINAEKTKHLFIRSYVHATSPDCRANSWHKDSKLV